MDNSNYLQSLQARIDEVSNGLFSVDSYANMAKVKTAVKRANLNFFFMIWSLVWFLKTT